jgi:cell division protein FtsI/penicillin-binding protein 2
MALVSRAEAKPAADADLSSIATHGAKATAPARSGGGTMQLTIDPELERRIQKILASSKAPGGAIVMSEVQTGRIVAWAAIGKEGDLVRKAAYPGASVFKVVTAAALLEGGYVKPGDSICFGGGESRLRAKDVEPGCHPGDSRTRFDKALGKSINVVFARLALEHLSPAEEGKMARSFGIGEEPLFDLPADTSFVKLPADKVDFARAAAGFGDAKLTPLAALFMMQTVANGGERVRLHVVGDPSSVKREVLGRAISEKTADELVKMLEVTTRSGTSRKAFREKKGRPNVRVAGKTGTLGTKHPKRLVSWFAGFAPSRHPKVAIAVMLANDEKWWRKGNEVARDALDAYFELNP